MRFFVFVPALVFVALSLTGSNAHRTPVGSIVQVEQTVGSAPVGNIDNDVFAVMQASDVHGASLAIIDGTRLVYAKGYTWGSPNLPAVTPTTLFRQASVSKLITALAVMQLIGDHVLMLNTPMQSVLHLRAPGAKAPFEPSFNDITIQDLLEMRGGLDPNLPWMDARIARALNKALPIDPDDIGAYAASRPLISRPGDRSRAFYNNSDYVFLGYVVAKARHARSFVAALEDPMLRPLAITRIRAARPLIGEQLPDEATYYPNPYQTARSVMTPGQPWVELGYGETNFANDEAAGGLSAAATDVARILAAMNLNQNNPAFKPGLVDEMLRLSYGAFHNPAFTHKDAQGYGDAFGFYGLDDVQSMNQNGSGPPYHADKGGLISTSQNAVYFQTGGLGYVICWNGHTIAGENWYPVFNSVMQAASAVDWGTTDLFPQYGMPSFVQPSVLHTPIWHQPPLRPRPSPGYGSQ